MKALVGLCPVHLAEMRLSLSDRASPGPAIDIRL